MSGQDATAIWPSGQRSLPDAPGLPGLSGLSGSNLKHRHIYFRSGQMPRCPRCPDVWAKRKHPGRPDTKPDGLHPGCLGIWASGLLPSLHPGIRLLASSGQGQTSGSSWRAWTPARIQVHLGEPRRGLNGPIRASGLAWFVWPETPGCTVMAVSHLRVHC